MQLAEDKKQKIYDKALGSIKHWLERFDTIIIGPGLGRDEMVHHVVIEVGPLCLHMSNQHGSTVNQSWAGRALAFTCCCTRHIAYVETQVIVKSH